VYSLAWCQSPQPPSVLLLYCCSYIPRVHYSSMYPALCTPSRGVSLPSRPQSSVFLSLICPFKHVLRCREDFLFLVFRPGSSTIRIVAGLPIAVAPYQRLRLLVRAQLPDEREACSRLRSHHITDFVCTCAHSCLMSERPAGHCGCI
jgi:hypothetical protein